MKYFLYIWITGCVGLGCPIPDQEVQEFPSMERCEEALKTAMRVAKMATLKKSYAGICLPQDAHTRIQEVWDEHGNKIILD